MKNADHREKLKKAPTTGLQLAGNAEKQKLPEQFVQESLILSDILELNEFVCVDLLLAGEQQQPNFPGLTRGLVAVLLYHDGRRCLASALRTLIQSREGLTWTLGLYEDLTQLVTKFTDELLKQGIISLLRMVFTNNRIRVGAKIHFNKVIIRAIINVKNGVKMHSFGMIRISDLRSLNTDSRNGMHP